MENRILIWKSITEGNEIDIFNQTDYSNFNNYLINTFGGNCPNWGNKLWFQGLYSEINDGHNKITFRSNESIDEINNNYDFVIYPMANFFATQYAPGMESLANTLSQIKIPVYIIACGAQADSYDDLDNLINSIGEPSKKFISAVYNTGGEFALRGKFTKEFFNRLGFSSVVVTGCPSLYQLGKDFQIDNSKVNISSFNPIFNGNFKLYFRAIREFNKSIYIDQDLFADCLYNSSYLDNTSLKCKINFYRNYGIESAELLSKNKIRMIADMNDWYSYIKNGKFNYSFGTRIHGSIMAILAGVPATVLAIDTRTREMAEFFDIPYVLADYKKNFSAEDIYRFYMEADYTKFNQTYQEKYTNYENFLKEHKIVTSINENNTFFDVNKSSTEFEKHIKNTEKFKDFHKYLKINKPLFSLGAGLMDMKARISKK